MAKFFTPSKISENIKETPEKYLLCLNVPVARTGWQEYGQGETPLEADDDGLVMVYRDAKEVFRPQTIASFNGKSVTIRHPDDFVGPDNWKILTIGVIQNARRGSEKDSDGEEMLLADLLITDAMAIGLVSNGLREVSCGYDAEYEQIKKGEGKQLNIVGNHIALVEQGRAGETYAIKDNKREDRIMTLKEIAEVVKNLGKTVDAAAKAKDEEKPGEKKEEAKDEMSMDDLVKAVKDLGEKVEGMNKPKDEDKPAEKKEEKKESEDEEEEESKDEEAGEKEIGARVAALEAAIAKILKKLGSEDEDMEDADESDMSGDEDMEESKDEDKEESEDEEYPKKTGDASRFEILTPGKKYKGEDARAKCLKEFSKSEEGAKVLRRLGLSKPVFDSKTNVDMLFMAASALVKTSRGVGLSGTKDSQRYTADDVDNTASDGMSADQLNELNAKHYGLAK